MQCLILAGGLATRMRPVIGDLPKTLTPVAGRPFADHQLSWLAAAGVGRVVYAIGARDGAVRDFVGDGARWGIEAAYSDDGPSPRGTGGAVRLAVDRGLMDAAFFVLYGDSYLNVDVGAVWRASGEGARNVMCVIGNDGRRDAANARYEDGRVTRFEKGLDDPAGAGLRHIDYGLSVLTGDAVVRGVPRDRPFDLAGLQGALAAAGALAGFEVRDRFYEIGSPEGLGELEARLASGPERSG